MDPLSIVMLASGLLSAGVNAYSTYRSTQATNEANKRLADLEFAQNQQQVAEQNAYNSPSQQMLRLAAAGLNPNLVYNSGNVVGNQSGLAQYQKPRANVDYGFRFNPLESLGQYSTMALQDAQVDQARSSVNLQTAQANLANANAANAAASKARTDFELSQAQALREDVLKQAGMLSKKMQTDLDFQGKMLDADLKLKESSFLLNSQSSLINSYKLNNYELFGSDEAPWQFKAGTNVVRELMKYPGFRNTVSDALSYPIINPFKLLK